MTSPLAALYGQQTQEPTLDDISAADFLAAAEQGQIDLGDFVDLDKTAGVDLSVYTDEEIASALAELDQAENIEKLASSEEGVYWDTVGRMMAHSYADEMDKVASEDVIDLNELDPEDIIDLAYDLAEEGFDKVASEVYDDLPWDDDSPYGIDLNQLTEDEFIELGAELEKNAAAQFVRKLRGLGPAARKDARNVARTTRKRVTGAANRARRGARRGTGIRGAEV